MTFDSLITNVDSYENLLHNNITTVYRKTDEAKVDEIEAEALEIATKLELEDRIFKTSKRDATITLKDHKPLFRENPSVRLINPTKPELRKAGKKILSRVVREALDHTLPNIFFPPSFSRMYSITSASRL